MSEDSLSPKDIEALLEATSQKEEKPLFDKIHADQIGRASCRERV